MYGTKNGCVVHRRTYFADSEEAGSEACISECTRSFECSPVGPGCAGLADPPDESSRIGGGAAFRANLN